MKTNTALTAAAPRRVDESFELAVAALDWGFKSRLLDRRGLEGILLVLPHNARMIRNWIDTRCDSSGSTS